MKKLLSLLLTIVMLLLGTGVAYAAVPEEEIVTHAYANISSFNATLDISSTGMARVRITCSALSSFTKVNIYTNLYHYENGEWVRVSTETIYDWKDHLSPSIGTSMDNLHKKQLTQRGNYKIVALCIAYGTGGDGNPDVDEITSYDTY